MRTTVRSFDARSASHVGLLLDRLTPSAKGTQVTTDAQRDSLRATTAIRAAAPYGTAFEAWEEYQRQAQAVCMTATTAGPLAIGLGNASPYEVGLTLHHTYGVPYLPGTALKGLARRAALRNGLTERDEAFKVLFGDQTAAGHVTWWDGWLDPLSFPALQLDTITVHHPRYYRDGKVWPTDFDDPTPVTFLSVPVGVKFHLALGGPTDWAHLAAQLLEYGLVYLGLGGKTNAGYGGFTVEREKSAAERAEEERQAAERVRQEQEVAEVRKHAARAEQFRRQIAGMNMGKAGQDVRNLLPQLKALPQSVRDDLLAQLLARLEGDTRTRADRQLLTSVRDALGETP